MRYSIRTSFTVLFVAVTVAILMLCWGANRWYLGTYYTRERQNTIIEVYAEIDRLILEGADKDTLSLKLEQFSDQYNISMILMTSVGENIFSSSADAPTMWGKIQKYILGIDRNKNEILYKFDTYEILRTYEKRIDAYYLEAWGFFSDNSLFMMSTPLASIDESVNISSKFLTNMGIIAVIFSSVIIYIATRQITEPILRLTDISAKVSNLDFSEKFEPKDMNGDSDEITMLGNNINIMSERLKRTIEDLKAANRMLQKDIDEKIKIDNMRKEFLSNVSHELKTPIALIQGYAEGLLEGISDDKENRDFYCEIIMDEAGKMNKIVRQLLDLSHIESDDNAISMETFNLVELLEGLLHSFDLNFKQKSVELQFTKIVSPLMVIGDEFKIEEILTNYLSNALNHVSGDKIIRLSVEELEKSVRVLIYNTGELIPENDLPEIWGKFYKVDKARTREYGGSGIGLSIVKAIMEAHNQKFGVKNCDNGVEFWFELSKAM